MTRWCTQSSLFYPDILMMYSKPIILSKPADVSKNSLFYLNLTCFIQIQLMYSKLAFLSKFRGGLHKQRLHFPVPVSPFRLEVESVVKAMKKSETLSNCSNSFCHRLSHSPVGSAIPAAKTSCWRRVLLFRACRRSQFPEPLLSYNVVRNPNIFESGWGRNVPSSDDPSTVTQSLIGPNQCLSLVLDRAF